LPYGRKHVPGLLGNEDAVNCLLIFVRQARGQEFLLYKFYFDLEGFGLKVLVLIFGSFIVVECSLHGDRESVDNPAAVG